MIKRIFISLAITFIFSAFFFSCYYDNEEALYPEIKNSTHNTCDTSNVTYSGIIAPMLNYNCYSCHSNANSSRGGGVRLETIADVISSSPKILAAINHTGPFPMPPGGKIVSCSITQFEIWVRKGMPNN